MFCTKCGSRIPEQSKFCVTCGARVEPEIGQSGSVIQGKDIQPTQEHPNIKHEPVNNAPFNNIPVNNTPINNTPVNIPLVNTPPVNPNTKKKSKMWLIPVICLVAIAIIGIGGFFIYDKVFNNDEQSKESKETTADVTKEPETVEAEEAELSFSESEVKIDKAAAFDLSALLTLTGIEKSQLVWESDSPNKISVDSSGKVTALEMGVSAVITVSFADNDEVLATCNVISKSEGDYFTEELTALNSKDAKLESIDVFANNYSPAKRNKKYTWDKTLFYTLEEISPDNEKDGEINSYNIEKKQLINAQTGKKMEYEIYRNPDTDKVNKIVSIEYAGDVLKISDYYYNDKGKVSFIFTREDINYIPTYANPTIDGERYYFNKDVMVKWRIVKDSKMINYAVGKKEKSRDAGKVTIYDKLSKTKKKAYDQKEIDMINAAYNTYNIVLAAEGISSIIGYVVDENGNPMNQAKIRLYSVQYDAWVLETTTDEMGLYSIIVPSGEAQYNIEAEYSGYVTTDLYNINMNNQSIGLYQENIYLVNSTGSSYDMQLVLCDALNKAVNYDGMVRLSNASVNIRTGINHEEGDIYQSGEADSEGLVTINLAEGTYTAEINKSGYATTYYTVVAKAGNEVLQINTSPILGENEVRIVLTWDSNPSDLDSHLFTPYDSSSGDSTYHIWYGNKTDNNFNNLDVDDTDGYGPETMTINHLGNGLYKYYVADYVNCSNGDTSSTAMSTSGARVSVYTKEGLVQSFYVPNNRSGVIWELFEIRNKRIIPIQRYYSNIADKTWWKNEK